MARMNINELLAQARANLHRLTPAQAHAASRGGGILIDTRSDGERRDHGTVPGSLHYPLSVLEWAVDPASGYGDPAIDLDSWIILICAEGYSSSLAAARLQSLGFRQATDVVGGFNAWLEAGLPVDRPHPG